MSSTGCAARSGATNMKFNGHKVTVIARPVAKAAGLKFYFTGKPCPAGHVTKRFVNNWACYGCHQITMKLRNKRLDIRQRSRRRWRLNDPDRARRVWAKNRHRRRAAKGRFAEADILKLAIKQQWECAALHCRVSIREEYHVDHKQPISRGGTNWPRNLQLLCAKCNTSKGSRTMREWLNAMSGLKHGPVTHSVL